MFCRSRPPRSLVLIGTHVWSPRQRERVRGRHQPPVGIVFQGGAALHAAPAARAVHPSPPRKDTALHDHRPPPRDLACRAKPRGRVGGGIRRRRATGLPPLRDSQLWVCPGTVRHLRSRFSRGLLGQGAGRLPIVQRQAHGADRGALGRSRYSTSPHAAVGDLRAEASAVVSWVSARSCLRTHEHLHDRSRAVCV